MLGPEVRVSQLSPGVTASSRAEHEPAPHAGLLHHVELWVPDLARAVAEWGWLLTELGYAAYQDWPDGRSWRLGCTYLVVEQSPALTAADHDRCRPGLNHLAFQAGSRDRTDTLARAAPEHGWTPLFAGKYPFAGGPEHYACYLANGDGFEVELVAGPGDVRGEAHDERHDEGSVA